MTSDLHAKWRDELAVQSLAAWHGKDRVTGGKQQKDRNTKEDDKLFEVV